MRILAFHGLHLLGVEEQLAGEKRDVFELALRGRNIWNVGRRGGVKKGD